MDFRSIPDVSRSFIGVSESFRAVGIGFMVSRVFLAVSRGPKVISEVFHGASGCVPWDLRVFQGVEGVSRNFRFRSFQRL